MTRRFELASDDEEVRTFPAVVIPVRRRPKRRPAPPVDSRPAGKVPSRKIWHSVTVQLDSKDPSQCWVISRHPNWHHKLKTPQRLVPDSKLAGLLQELSVKEKYKGISIDPYNPKRRKDNDPIRTNDYYSEDECNEPESPDAPRAVDIAPVRLKWRFYKHCEPSELARDMKIATRDKRKYLQETPSARLIHEQFGHTIRSLKSRVDSGRVPRITNIIAFGLKSLHQYQNDPEECEADNIEARSKIFDVLRVRDIFNSEQPRDAQIPFMVEGASLSSVDKSYLSSLGLIPVSEPEVFNHVNAQTLVLNLGQYADMDCTAATNVFPAAYLTMDHVAAGYEPWEQRACRFLKTEYRVTPLVSHPDSHWRIYTRRFDVEPTRRPFADDGDVGPDERPWVRDGVFVHESSSGKADRVRRGQW